MGNAGNVNLLHHEYGHIMQLQELGLVDYLTFVAVPSVLCYWGTELGYFPEEYYYSYPWEYQADQYGRSSHVYEPWANDLSSRYWDAVNRYR